MRQPLEELWRKRRAAFRKEVFPYAQSMVQSGFPGFVILLLILGMLGYGSLLRHMTPSFPYVAVGIAALTPVLCYSPLRTWLRPADVAFLMPRESEMGGYLRLSWRHNLIAGVLLSALVLALYMPLYERAAGAPQPWLAMGAAALGLKLLNAAASWRERQLAWPAARRGLRLLRWSCTALILAALLLTALWKAALFALLLAGVLALALRLPARHTLPWERLMLEEERTRQRYYRFFGSFTDVPELPSSIARRPYLAWMAARIRYSHSHTYRYMFALTLLRTELGGIVLRLTLLGLLAVTLAVRSALFEGWGAVFFTLLFLFLLRIQASSLLQSHRHSVWRHIYPLPQQQHNDAFKQVVVTTLLICAVALCLPLIWLLASGIIWPLIIAVVVSFGYVLLRLPRQLLRKIDAELED
ncbi:ABC transporter permease [Paenibacillus sp. SYP-B4298]|uniref:ABC transporter permease n=1 Tax=Paenibacillus sp. SYP-B4298 TaxID=2996034 RepID=UPI0022DE0A3B|nr:ABC transporter permease [Paenibacillus sp. SYP-B4298]